MHERAGDRIFPKMKFAAMSRVPQKQIASVPQSSDPLKQAMPAPLPPDRKSVVEANVQEEHCPISVPPPKSTMLMTRRFSIADKLRILDKYHETSNISATCRWVRTEFRRATFARKSLADMISREEVYRGASGTKAKRKTVRPRTGSFYRMDKALAS